MPTGFDSHLDYLSDEMCQMNTRIGCIAHRQSRLSGFTPPTPEPTKESSSDGGDDDDDGASCSETDDKMIASQ